MAPPGNATAPPPLANVTLRTTAHGYPTINPEQLRREPHGRIALITGSGRGIGKGMAYAFAEAGYSICVTARNAAEVETTTQEIQRANPQVKVIGVVADGCKLEDLETLVSKVNDQLGTIDVLVCNAGTNTFMPFTMTDPKDWWYSLEINLKSPTELTRIVLPQMRKRNSGTIIYTSSRAAVADLPWTTAYGAGKTGITRFAACLQNELNQTQQIDYGFEHNGIALYSIHPGEIETALHTTGFPEQTHREAPYIVEFMKGLDAKRPKFDVSLPAWTCVYLASEKCDHRLRGKYVDCTRDLEEQAGLYGPKL